MKAAKKTQDTILCFGIELPYNWTLLSLCNCCSSYSRHTLTRWHSTWTTGNVAIGLEYNRSIESWDTEDVKVLSDYFLVDWLIRLPPWHLHLQLPTYCYDYTTAIRWRQPCIYERDHEITRFTTLYGSGCLVSIFSDYFYYLTIHIFI